MCLRRASCLATWLGAWLLDGTRSAFPPAFDSQFKMAGRVNHPPARVPSHQGNLAKTSQIGFLSVFFIPIVVLPSAIALPAAPISSHAGSLSAVSQFDGLPWR